MSNQDAIEHKNHAIEMGEALERLNKNPDFRKVILDGYLKEKVLASVSLLGVPQCKNERGSVMEDLVASSNLQYFFTMVESQYEGALNPVLSDEEKAELESMGPEDGELN